MYRCNSFICKPLYSLPLYIEITIDYSNIKMNNVNFYYFFLRSKFSYYYIENQKTFHELDRMIIFICKDSHYGI